MNTTPITIDKNGWMIITSKHREVYARQLEVFRIGLEKDKKSNQVLTYLLSHNLEKAGILIAFVTKHTASYLKKDLIIPQGYAYDQVVFEMMNTQAVLKSITDDKISLTDLVDVPNNLYDVGGKEALTLYTEIVLDYIAALQASIGSYKNIIEKLTIFTESAIIVLEESE